MSAVLGVTLPFFGLVLIGWIATRRGITLPGTVPVLNTFVLYFALPAALLRFVMNAPIEQVFNPSVMVVYGITAVLIVTIAFKLARRARRSAKDASFGALVAAFPNTGFMGIPLVVALFGSIAAGPTICVMIVDMLFTMSLCLALAQGDGERTSRWAGVLTALRGVARNPLPWSVLVGALLSVTHVRLFTALDSVIEMMATAATPVALFAIGAALALRRETTDRDAHPLRTDVVPLAAIKLVLHPLLLWGVGMAAIQLGVPLNRFALSIIVLVAALPSAGNAMMLAERNGADGGRIAWIILLTTSLAVVTFSGLAYLATPGR